jgi:hypothetical protein
LLKIGASDDRVIYNSKLEQINTSIRYCEYFQDKAISQSANLDLQEMDDILRAKVDEVLAKNKSEKIETLSWDGSEIPLRNEKIKAGLLKADKMKIKFDDMKSNSKEAQEEAENILNLLVVSHDEVESNIRSELNLIVNFFILLVFVV